MASITHILSLLHLILHISITLTTSTPIIGVTINHHPPSITPEQIASTITRFKIPAIRLPNPDPLLIRAFSYSSISLHLTIPNSLISSFSSNQSHAVSWLYSHVIPFYPRANITSISVGSDILSSMEDLSNDILPAIKNLHSALIEVGIKKIQVSTTFSIVPLLTSAFPPSSAEFAEPINDVIIKPLLDFLNEANSSLFVNVYPYNLFRLTNDLPLGYALFQEGNFNFRDDPNTGLRYRNLFNVMIDAVLSAMVVSGHENIPIIVTETGWPHSPGDEFGEENDANEVFAEMYLKGLIDHLKSGIGTPLKKDSISEIYIFELFDKEVNGSLSTRQWGILYPNATMKYKIDFNGGSRIGICKGLLLFLAIWFMMIAFG
ncbi:glucan endo-1,3-beta-glucosidase 2 [Amaranthus tricolor]|uniref:glucan endo-1,3-beta-glucosidase 2 n=1 Tax=Amaranthus tricolor TaxID=29722 RepID=UPI00258271A5|nr:glucan endo-1,3-beta-glucosidase 2 [Amaranthus tricolor]